MLVEIDGEMIALFHVGGSFYAIDDVCTHDGGPLVDGDLQDYTIACPRHGAKFDIRTGSALSMPAIRPTLSHDVKVEDGSVFVRIRENGSGPNGNPMPSTTLPLQLHTQIHPRRQPRTRDQTMTQQLKLQTGRQLKAKA